MNATKQKILGKSLELFNANGISKTSLRTIADELGISVGNLQYHFKKREDIIEALYFELVDKMDALIFVPSENILKSVLQLSQDVSAQLFEYHFFLVDFVAITRKNSKIKQHYAELSMRREAQSLELANLLIAYNVFRAEAIKGEYQSSFKRFEVISNFWFSSVLIQEERVSKACLEEYALLMAQSIYPYLTTEGRQQYMLIFPDQALPPKA